jgi:hypothetical protein
MSSSELIALAAVAVSSGTALLVAYWHRKQMRQIEEFRRDPSVGLRPPPSRFWAFLKLHRLMLVGVGLPALALIGELSLTGPITRWTVLAITGNVSAMLFAVMTQLTSRILQFVKAIVDIQARQLGIQDRHLDLIELSLTREPTQPPRQTGGE